MTTEIVEIGKTMDLVDLDVGLNGRSFTVGWLLESLRKHDDEFRKLHAHRQIQKVESVDVSGGKGFVSIVLRCTLHFTDSVDESDVYTTIMKIPGTESIDEVIEKSTAEFEMENEFVTKLIKFHKFECDFYEHLAPKLEIPVPKVYKTAPWIYKKAEGCLHMEDLTTRGKSMSFWDTINISQIKDVVRHLAHMHKQLLILDDQEWRGKFMENQRAFCDGNNQFDRFHSPFLKFAKDNGKFMEEMFKKYDVLTKNPEFVEYINCISYKDLDLPSVLVHGDLHAGNIMWDINEHGDLTNEVAAFVDWQIMHEGSPMSDIARILTLCADGNVRREAELFIVEFYHDLLTQELKSVGRENPYKLENLKKAYDICFFGQAFHLPVMVVFLEPSLSDSEELKTIKEAKIDKMVLRSIHGWEDLDRKFSSEQYSFLHKFNQK